ncbi:MAG: hypothetical protein JW726_08315 [Anaerolineales bacterium]|nr:hypothetical protein [Anaerolineales bacterium]
MSIRYQCKIPNPQELYLRNPAPEIVTWQRREALRLSSKGACLALHDSNTWHFYQ